MRVRQVRIRDRLVVAVHSDGIAWCVNRTKGTVLEVLALSPIPRNADRFLQLSLREVQAGEMGEGRGNQVLMHTTRPAIQCLHNKVHSLRMTQEKVLATKT